jgi:hypothetical protein
MIPSVCGALPHQPPMPELVRTLRLRDLLLLFVGSVIGSGIFRTPGPIVRQVDGSVGLSLLVWLVGGVLSLLGALTYAELAAANPEAGGLYGGTLVPLMLDGAIRASWSNALRKPAFWRWAKSVFGMKLRYNSLNHLARLPDWFALGAIRLKIQIGIQSFQLLAIIVVVPVSIR